MADQFGELDLFLAVEQRTVGLSCTKPFTTKQQSVFWLVSQSRRMSAIYVGTCWWISLAAASGDPVVATLQQPVHDSACWPIFSISPANICLLVLTVPKGAFTFIRVLVRVPVYGFQ